MLTAGSTSLWVWLCKQTLEEDDAVGMERERG